MASLPSLQQRNLQLKEELRRLQLLERLTQEEKLAEATRAEGSIQQLYDRVNQAKTAFDRIDTDNSGAIDADELQALALQLGEVLEGEELEEVLRNLDRNGNGKIEFYEFLLWWSTQDSTPGSEKSIAKLLHLRAKLQQGKLEEMGQRLVRQLSGLAPAAAAATNKHFLRFSVGNVPEHANTSAFLELSQGGSDNDSGKVDISFCLNPGVTDAQVEAFVGSFRKHLKFQERPRQSIQENPDGSRTLTVGGDSPPIPFAEILRQIQISQHVKKFQASLKTQLTWQQLIGDAPLTVADLGVAELKLDSEVERQLFTALSQLQPELFFVNFLKNLDFQLEFGDLGQLLGMLSDNPIAATLEALLASPALKNQITDFLKDLPIPEENLEIARVYRDTVQELTQISLVFPGDFGLHLKLKNFVPSVLFIQSCLDETDIASEEA